MAGGSKQLICPECGQTMATAGWRIFGGLRVTTPDVFTCSTGCYAVNMSTPEITQRDLRSRSREIMDAVEHGQSFTVTRDGHQIGELVPIRRRRRFVSRQEFAAMSRNAPAADPEAFRADQDAAADHEAGGAY
jgi:prevent-host-death family protein